MIVSCVPDPIMSKKKSFPLSLPQGQTPKKQFHRSIKYSTILSLKEWKKISCPWEYNPKFTNVLDKERLTLKSHKVSDTVFG